MLLAVELFGGKHLVGLVLCMVVVGAMFLLSEVMLKRNTKVVLYFVLVLFFVLEFLKIGYIWIDKGSYPMNHLPFHLCSLPLYLMPLVSFVKNEKILKYVLPATVGGLMFGGTVAMLYPVNILGAGTSFLPLSENFLPLLSFVYHPLMIFTAIYLVYSGTYRISFMSFRYGYPIIVGFLFIAMIANKILDKDFMLLNKGIGSPFQFLQETSQSLYVASMVFLGLFGVFLFHSVVHMLAKATKMEETSKYAYKTN